MIQAVRSHQLSTALHTPFVTALRRTETVDTVIVEIEDADGRRGYGEAPQVWQVTGESLAGARACIDGPLSDTLIGRDPDDLVALLRTVERSVAANSGAKAAVDVALHDLAARRRELSLPRFLGATRHQVATDVTVSAADPTQLAGTARQRRDDGFGVLKLKVGTDAERDVSRVRAVREAVGPDITLRLDANQGWSPRAAATVITALEDADLDIELVEQPVAAADLEGMRWVSDRVATPILADESVYSVRDLIAVIRSRAADMVNVKLAKCGGLRPARTLLELAYAHGVGSIVGSMMESQIGVGAAASLVAAYETTAVSDLDAAWWTVESPFDGGLTYQGSIVQLPERPGLGIEGWRR